MPWPRNRLEVVIPPASPAIRRSLSKAIRSPVKAPGTPRELPKNAHFESQPPLTFSPSGVVIPGLPPTPLPKLSDLHSPFPVESQHGLAVSQTPRVTPGLPSTPVAAFSPFSALAQHPPLHSPLSLHPPFPMTPHHSFTAQPSPSCPPPAPPVPTPAQSTVAHIAFLSAVQVESRVVVFTLHHPNLLKDGSLNPAYSSEAVHGRPSLSSIFWT
jgi:hypothetical protein